MEYMLQIVHCDFNILYVKNPCGNFLVNDIPGKCHIYRCVLQNGEASLFPLALKQAVTILS